MTTFNVDLTADEGYAIAWPAHRLSVMRRTVDFTDTENQLAQNGIMGVFKIPADCKVLQFGMKVKTADTDVTDVDLGLHTQTAAGAITAVDVDGFADGVTLASTGYVAMDVDAAYNPQGASAGYIVAADSVLSLTNNDSDTINQAKIDFFAILLDVSKPDNITVGGSESYST